jgi:polyhydroxybutyrate depolymerase
MGVQLSTSRRAHIVLSGGMRQLLLVVAITGCSPSALLGNHESPADSGAAQDLGGLAGGSNALTAARPYHFFVPSGYDMNNPTPLVILLHGYSANAEGQELYFNLKQVAESKIFLYAYPDGTVDSSGNRFWNATDACCNFNNLPVDDVAYVNAIIDDVSTKYNVDPHRIFITGHSNGGFMSHRLACEAPRVAAIVSLAGALWKDSSRCQPAQPVSILQVHGTADAVINYDGGQLFGREYPSAHDTVATWADKNGCSSSLIDTGTSYDLDSTLAGAETQVERFDHCPPTGAVELWTIQGGSHIPALQPSWAETIYAFLSAHPKQ